MNYCMREKGITRSRPFNVFGIMMEMPQAKGGVTSLPCRSFMLGVVCIPLTPAPAAPCRG